MDAVGCLGIAPGHRRKYRPEPQATAVSLVTVVDYRNLRIGDAERDEAVRMLQDHHAAGRLDVVEFEQRMAGVLAAQTQADIDAFFLDLPEPTPAGQRLSPAPSAHAMAAPTAGSGLQRSPDSGLARSWWIPLLIVLVSVFIVGMTRHGFSLIPIGIFVAIFYSSFAKSCSGKNQTRNLPTRDDAQVWNSQLSTAQRREISREISFGRRDEAIKLYRKYTGVNLGLAEAAIDTWDQV